MLVKPIGGNIRVASTDRRDAFCPKHDGALPAIMEPPFWRTDFACLPHAEVYNYFRDYDPALGRFVESDPIGLEGGLNTYAYAGSDPLLNLDPDGLSYFCMYSQSSHTLSCFDNDGKGKEVINDPGCYAGNGKSKNNPLDNCSKDHGPLPRGWYDIGPGYNHKRLGNPTFNLNPQPGTNMCTPLRDKMRIHADSIAHPGDASDGCVVCRKSTREQLQRGGGGTLFVTQ